MVVHTRSHTQSNALKRNLAIKNKALIVRSLNRTVQGLKQASGLYSRSKHFRPLILQILRQFEFMDLCIHWTQFLQATFRKSNEQLALLYEKMEFVDADEKQYLTMLINNLQSFRQKCIDSTVYNFSKLPGHIPLEIKNHIVGFIAAAPTRF